MTRPPYLKIGDKIAVVAMASGLDYEQLLPALKLLRDDWGLRVIEGESLKTRHYQFAGDDDTRSADLQNALDDPEIKAVFSARGGYGVSRIIDRLSFKKFKKSPKWIVGFSDITLLINHLCKLNFEAIHAEMPKSYTKPDRQAAVESVKKALFGEALQYNIAANTYNRNGIAQGELMGGNLCLMAHLIGTKSMPDTAGRILFLEDVGEPRYNIDRLMIQLKRAGKLKNLSGLVVGTFSDVKDEDPPFDGEPYDIIQRHVAEYNYPVCYDFPVGHTARNMALIVGREITLSVDNEKVSLVFKK